MYKLLKKFIIGYLIDYINSPAGLLQIFKYTTTASTPVCVLSET